jgi:hypothetical protein
MAHSQFFSTVEVYAQADYMPCGGNGTAVAPLPM